MRNTEIQKLVKAQKLLNEARALVGEVAISNFVHLNDKAQLIGFAADLGQVLGYVEGNGLQAFTQKKLTEKL